MLSKSLAPIPTKIFSKISYAELSYPRSLSQLKRKDDGEEDGEKDEGEIEGDEDLVLDQILADLDRNLADPDHIRKDLGHTDPADR